MDHAHVAAHGLIDRYREGLLDPEIEAQFEEHFMGCAECTAELDVARSLARGVRAMAAEDAAAAARRSVGPFAWLVPRGRLDQGALAAAAVLLVAVALPLAWAIGRGSGRATFAAAVDYYRGRWVAVHAQAADLRHGLHASEAARAAERDRFARQLDGARAGSGTGAAAGTGSGTGAGSGTAAARPWTEPLLDAPLVLLHTFRDEPGAAPRPIPAAAAARPLSLAIDVGDAAGTGDAAAGAGDAGDASDAGAPGSSGAAARRPGFRIELRDHAGRLLLGRDGLHANGLGVLLMTFPPGFFAPGDYRLVVTRQAAAGAAAQPFGTYPLRVAAR